MKTRLERYRLHLCCAASLVLLAACGGGSSGSGAGALPAIVSSQISGAVIDGYIEGAKVCLDLNGNGGCESSEPTATTTASGSFTLNTGGISTSGLHVIAEIPASAKDSDDGGQTLAAAGKSAYIMAAPAEKSNAITPLTTLLVGKIKTESLTMPQASARVLAQLGLPEGTAIHEDHIAKGNIAVGDAARQVAAQLQALQGSLEPNLSAADRWSRLQRARDDAEKAAGSISKISTTLNMPSYLAAVATGKILAYRMTSAKGRSISATAMLFTPKTPAPTSGWPLVVFGHGTTGLAPQCAPSVTMNASGTWDYAPLVAGLLAQGFAVVAPDYEGLGSPEMGVVPGHPYLDLRSAGQSMALAAVAAKRHLGASLSGAWATVGHSQGGHAALAGAQFSGLAKQLESTLNYQGAVAIAPASNLLMSLNDMGSSIAAVTPQSFQDAYAKVINSNLYAAYVVKGSQSTPASVAAAGVFGSRMLSVYNKSVETGCLSEFVTALVNDLNGYLATPNAALKNYPGVSLPAVNATPLAILLAAKEPGQSRLAGKTLIVQGSADTTVLPGSTNRLLATMKAQGSDVILSYQDNLAATHSGVLELATAQAAIFAHLKAVFAPPGGASASVAP